MKPLLLALSLLLPTLPIKADVHLLGSPQVRRELGLSRDLSLRILNNLNETALLNRGGLMTREEARIIRKLRRQTTPQSLEKQIMSWLSSSQKQRLEQIELQQGGPFIFEDWRFAQRVGLSPQQHQKLRARFNATFQRYVKGTQALSDSNKSWFGVLDHKKGAAKYAAYYRSMEKLGTQRKAAVQSALDHSLTPQQKAKWRALLGKPFLARLSYDTKSYPMD